VGRDELVLSLKVPVPPDIPKSAGRCVPVAGAGNPAEGNCLEVSPDVSVIALAGRRIDPPDARIRRFPLEAVDRVSSVIWREIVASGATNFVSSAACGADLIGLQVASQLGLHRHVVLPFDRDRFRETSVADRPGDWAPVFDRAIDSLEPGDLTVLGASESGRAWEVASHAILDRAVALAGRPDRVLAIVVWDGASRGQGDVTAGFEVEARQRGMRIAEVRTLASA
jgi:hypothetical protein